MFIFRENDVIDQPRPYYSPAALKNQSALIVLRLSTSVADTASMATIILRDSNFWSVSHLRRESFYACCVDIRRGSEADEGKANEPPALH